jgi:secreted trypsin-like serine protease
MSAKRPVMDRESCINEYSNTTIRNIDNGQFCVNVHATRPHQSSTGSPIVNHGNQIGLVAIEFGIPKYPTIYIDVTYFNKWIRKNLIDEN